MKSDRLSPAIMLAGIVLMVIGRFEYTVTHQTSGWTAQDAKTFAAAQANFHQQAHKHSADSSKPPEQQPAELRDARQEAERQQSRLGQARSRGMLIFQIIRWSGVGLTIVGVVRFLTVRVQNEQR